MPENVEMPDGTVRPTKPTRRERIAEAVPDAGVALPTVGCDTPGCAKPAKHLWAPGDGTETYLCDEHAGPDGPVPDDVVHAWEAGVEFEGTDAEAEAFFDALAEWVHERERVTDPSVHMKRARSTPSAVHDPSDLLRINDFMEWLDKEMDLSLNEERSATLRRIRASAVFFLLPSSDDSQVEEGDRG